MRFRTNGRTDKHLTRWQCNGKFNPQAHRQTYKTKSFNRKAMRCAQQIASTKPCNVHRSTFGPPRDHVDHATMRHIVTKRTRPQDVCVCVCVFVPVCVADIMSEQKLPVVRQTDRRWRELRNICSDDMTIYLLPDTHIHTHTRSGHAHG